MDRRLYGGEGALEQRTPLGLRHVSQVAAIEGEEVECDKRGGRLLRQLGDARRRGMQPKLEDVEIESVRRRDDDFSVHDAAVGQVRQKNVVQLGKVPIERPQVTA